MRFGLFFKLDLDKNSSPVSEATALIKIFECKSLAKLSKTESQANKHRNDMKSESQSCNSRKRDRKNDQKIQILNS